MSAKLRPQVRLAARMMASFFAGICADYWFGWLSFAPADRASRRRQRVLIIGLGLFFGLVVLLGSREPSAAVLPLASCLIVLSLWEFGRWVHGRTGR